MSTIDSPADQAASLRAAYGQATDETIFWMIREPATLPAILDLIAADPRPHIRIQLAQNIAGPHRQRILNLLINDTDQDVAQEARRATIVRRFRIVG